MLRDEREAYDRKDEESRALAEQLDAFKEAHDKKEEDLRNLAEQMEEMNQMMEEQQKLLEDQHSKLKEQENLINEREDRMKELEKLLEESKEETASKEEYDKAVKGTYLFCCILMFLSYSARPGLEELLVYLLFCLLVDQEEGESLNLQETTSRPITVFTNTDRTS